MSKNIPETQIINLISPELEQTPTNQAVWIRFSLSNINFPLITVYERKLRSIQPHRELFMWSDAFVLFSLIIFGIN